MDTLLNTLIAGLAYLIAGTCGITRHFLLEPRIKHFPRKPSWLLHVFFVFSATLLWIGLRFMWFWFIGEATVVPPGATGTGVVLALVTLLYKSSLLWDTWGSRYPDEEAETQRLLG